MDVLTHAPYSSHMNSKSIRLRILACKYAGARSTNSNEGDEERKKKKLKMQK